VGTTGSERPGEGHADSRARLRELIDTAPIGITEIDLDGRFVDANPMATELLQYSRAELLGKVSSELVSPRQQGRRGQALQLLIDGTERTTTYETTFVRKDGQEREAEVIATVLRDAAGNPRSILALIQDVTDRRGLEARVNAQAELINHAHDAIFVKQLADGMITFWNPAAARLYGYTAEEAVGRTSEDLLRTEFPEPPASVEASLQRTGGWSGELLHLTRAGEAVWVDSRWVVIRDRDGAASSVLEINRDISEERHLTDERQDLLAILEQQNRELRERDKLKNEFLLTISHELRTPLTAILGFSDLLALDSPLAERTELEIIQRNGRRLLSLIEDILTVAQVQAGELKLRPHSVDIVAVARRVVEGHRQAAVEKGLKLEFDGDARPARAVADEMATSHAIRHLVGNALKFTDRGEIIVRVLPEVGEVRVEVADTGVGVPREARDLIFEDFRQVDQSITRSHGGLGIGLSVVRRLVQLQGGRLGVDDRPGGGTVFWFTLPGDGEAQPKG
jgi:PAS domain S-box-containing protein